MTGLSCRHALGVLAALLVLTAHSAYADTKVRGVLKGAFIVNGVTTSGAAVSATPDAKGKFTLIFKGTSGRGATLQIISKSGQYFGPVVLGHKGTKGFTKLAGKSVNLRALKVLDAYATVKKVAASTYDRTTYVDTDSAGKPIGAGKLGLVSTQGGLRRHRLARLAHDGQGGAELGADTDGDGIPDAYDADDDGDRVLDGSDADSASNGSIHTGLRLTLGDALNVNATGVTPAEIDAMFSGADRFGMIFWFYRFEGPLFEGRSITGAHVDCLGLPYCGAGSPTAVIGHVSESSPSTPNGVGWDTFNTDGSPNNLEQIIRSSDPTHPVWAASVQPRAVTSQIQPGDAYNVVFDTDAGPVTVPTSLGGYFVTVPAIKSYDAGAGEVAINYPVDGSTPGVNGSNPIVLSGSTLRLTFWRPQRAAIAGAESGAYVDMGHLHYSIPMETSSQEFECAAEISDLSPTLTTGWTSSDTMAPALFPLTDSSDDAAPDASNTLSFTIDLGACLVRHGLGTSGAQLRGPLTAIGEPTSGGADSAVQQMEVLLP